MAHACVAMFFCSSPRFMFFVICFHTVFARALWPVFAQDTDNS